MILIQKQTKFRQHENGVTVPVLDCLKMFYINSKFVENLLTLKALITTAADDSQKYFFIGVQREKKA